MEGMYKSRGAEINERKQQVWKWEIKWGMTAKGNKLCYRVWNNHVVSVTMAARERTGTCLYNVFAKGLWDVSSVSFFMHNVPVVMSIKSTDVWSSGTYLVQVNRVRCRVPGHQSYILIDGACVELISRICQNLLKQTRKERQKYNDIRCA